jgi:hypothetical protein
MARHSAATGQLFVSEFDRLVIEFESINESVVGLVEKLEDIPDNQGGDVEDDDRNQRTRYKRNGVTFTFDLKKRRLEISFSQSGALEFVDAAQRFQLGIGRPSHTLPVPVQSDSASGVRAAVGVPVRKQRPSYMRLVSMTMWMTTIDGKPPYPTVSIGGMTLPRKLGDGVLSSRLLDYLRSARLAMVSRIETR